tara:strand:- start:11088 stop:12104 length:1017 start_codon:yes stop_codon:yes gene_type:complete
MKNPLVIVSNEKIYKESNDFYCDNLDLKVIPEGLNNYHNVQYIVRSSKKKSNQKINLENIKVGSNIFKFLYSVIKTLRIPNVTYLLICITPYTFLSFLILFLFRKKKLFVYLFSSGHEEYRYLLGRWSVWIYHVMYKIVTSSSKVIVCHERLHAKDKSQIVSISRLDDEWFSDQKKAVLDKFRFLYVGRMSAEKGIYQFLKMFGKMNLNAELSIVGNLKNHDISIKNVKLFGYIADPKSLINIYDNHNIMVLPSFTEATPYVVEESLSRMRPVIVFEDIAYIVRDKKGIFVSKRDINSFSETAKYIIENYIEIQQDIKKNKLATKNEMLKQLAYIVSN